MHPRFLLNELPAKIPPLDSLSHLSARNVTGPYDLCHLLRLREAVRDTTLAGYDVPKGSHVVVGIFHAQRDGRWHERPLEFRPERFEPEAAKAMKPGSYAPFGAGTRACIGKRFALMEATLILATLAQYVTLDAIQDGEPVASASITLAPLELEMRVAPAASTRPLSALAG